MHRRTHKRTTIPTRLNDDEYSTASLHNYDYIEMERIDVSSHYMTKLIFVL